MSSSRKKRGATGKNTPHPVVQWQPIPPDDILDKLEKKALLPKHLVEALGEIALSVAWSVARVHEMDILAKLRQHLLDIIATGGTLRDWLEKWKEVFRETPQALDFWHAQVVMRTTLASVYESIRYEQLAHNPHVEFLMYTAILDDRVRPEHAALHGMTWARDDFPPNLWPPIDYNCRCSVIPVTSEYVREMGIKIQTTKNVPFTPAPGFNRPPSLSALAQTLLDELRDRALKLGVKLPGI